MKSKVAPGVWIALILFVAVAFGTFGFVRFLVWGILGPPGEDGREAGDAVGLVRIRGAIFDSRKTISSLDRLRRNPRVKALVLRIESPGGGVGPTQEIYEEVLRFRDSGRNVVASLGSVAASGGYYIAAAADKIFANPGTITGSIGVIMVLPDVEKVLGKVGLKFNVIKSAPHKDLASPLRAMTEKDRQILQRLVDDTYGQFIRAIVESRKLSREEVVRVADGSIFSGERAKELGLVDALGTQHDATLEAARLAGIPGEPKIIEMKPSVGLLGLLAQMSEAAAGWFNLGELKVLGEYPAVVEYMWR